MHATDVQFAGSIPAIYDRYLVPLLFQPYADDLAERLAGLTGGVLLEVAAGTGAVTAALRARLPAEVELVSTDLNPGMLELGARRLRGSGVSFRQADAQQLPFDVASFDAMVAQFGVMFLPDKRAGFREAFRVLREGARYVFNVWNRVQDNEVTLITGQVLAELFPDDPPRFMQRTPFGYFDPGVIRDDVTSAGFRRVEIETLEKTTEAPSADEVAFGLCQGTPFRNEIELRDASRLDEVTAAVSAALRRRFGAGRFENRMSALVVSAWR